MAGRRRGPAGGGACGLLSVTVALMAHGALGCWAEEPTQPGESLSSGFAVPQEQAVAAQLVAEHTSVPPGGSTRVGVAFEIEPGWHIYADPPGDAGLPTRVTWGCGTKDPWLGVYGCSDVQFEELHWPPPEEFVDPGNIRTRGYEESVVPFSTLSASSRLAHTLETPYSRIPVFARVEWLACKDVCIPGRAEVEFILPVQEGPQLPSVHAKLFEPVTQ